VATLLSGVLASTVRSSVIIIIIIIIIIIAIIRRCKFILEKKTVACLFNTFSILWISKIYLFPVLARTRHCTYLRPDKVNHHFSPRKEWLM
jgi:hypothetical protein